MFGSGRNMRPRASTFWFTLLVGHTGCRPEDTSPNGEVLLYDSPDFQVWASEDLQTCEGTFPYTEQWLDRFHEHVGPYGTSRQPVIHWLSPDDFGVSPCAGTVACVPPSNIIYSSLLPIEHEFVHAILDNGPPSVLREGVAEVFGSIGPGLVNVASVEDLIEKNRLDGPSYATAARFTRFIIDEYGIDGYFEVYEGLDGVRTKDEFAVEIETYLNVDLPTLLADFEEVSNCSMDRWRFYDVECSSMEVTPWREPTLWAEHIDLSCSSPDVIGPRRGVVWTRRALNVEQDGFYWLHIDSDDPTASVLANMCNVPCANDDPLPGNLGATIGQDSRIFLRPGRHWLQIQHADSTNAPVYVTIQP